MKKGICPKCGSNEIYCDQERVSNHQPSYHIPITGMRHSPVDQYICTSCGFIERYISDLIGLEQQKYMTLIQKKWRKVN